MSNELEKVFESLWDKDKKEIDEEFVKEWLGLHRFNIPIINYILKNLEVNHPDMLKNKWKILTVILGSEWVRLSKELGDRAALETRGPTFTVTPTNVPVELCKDLSEISEEHLLALLKLEDAGGHENVADVKYYANSDDIVINYKKLKIPLIGKKVSFQGRLFLMNNLYKVGQHKA